MFYQKIDQHTRGSIYMQKYHKEPKMSSSWVANEFKMCLY